MEYAVIGNKGSLIVCSMKKPLILRSALDVNIKISIASNSLGRVRFAIYTHTIHFVLHRDDG